MIIHPLEMVEDGLSEVEERLYRELAVSTGARNVIIYVGSPLTDTEVVAVSENKK